VVSPRERSLGAGRAVFTYGSAEHYLGRLAATMGERERAETHFGAALAKHESMGSPPLVALTERRRAELRGAV
jgi:hypothetical protein